LEFSWTLFYFYFSCLEFFLKFYSYLLQCEGKFFKNY
jgi:hypothetical protein